MESVYYPLVFVHGLFGWGEGSGLEKNYHYWGFGGADRDLAAHLREAGCEVYAPSNGPVSGAWDRACELWAILCGGTVDYGAAHAKRYGHARFGRTYPGLLPDWGEPGKHEKIHLLAHSFGGAVARLFSSLAAYGDGTERAATPEGDLSPLFAGGHGGRILSVTTFSGVNNGTTFADFWGNTGMRLIAGTVYGANALAGETPLMRLYDFDSDQWGVMSDPFSKKGERLSLPAKFRRVRDYNRNGVDHIGHEMQLPVMALMNSKMRLDPETYYFACRACRTHETKRGNQLPNRNMRKILKVWSTMMGRYRPAKLLPFGFDESWLPSDGIVNVRGLSAPLDQPFEDYPADEALRPGIWYNLPVEDKHHMSWVGIGEDPAVFFAYYEALCSRLKRLEPQ
ncbi:MAG: hypothetical protein IJK40_05220 [Clostridia bacterium]|nr:hypothetical protein [Clostridia bacterium]MBR0537530.1 hypothetical protein [Clostridia bacterium]